MGCCTWWLTIALYFWSLAASQANKTTLLPVVPFDESKTTELPVTVQYYGEEVEDADEEDVVEDDKDQIELLSRDFMDTNPTEVKGQPVFEGDILLTQSQWRAFRERKGLASLAYRWRQGSDGYPFVPYRFADSRVNKPIIRQAIQHWMDHTCIKFEETTNTNQPHLRFIYGRGCYSYLGMIYYWKGQDVSIGRGCDTLGIVVHEIGHAIGFVHEQSRPDRDRYVVINNANILSTARRNFIKYSTSYVNTRNVMYDYTSIMHYGSTAFSINGKTTIATRNFFAQGLIGQRIQLTHRDKHLANIMYNCIGKWLAKCRRKSDPCRNGGYFGACCECVCPPGTSGTCCEKRTGNYYGSLQNGCNAVVTKTGTLTSPNYPRNYPRIQCVKIIIAPRCYVPVLTFSYFRLWGKNPYCSGGRNCCYFDALEIRTRSNYYGDVFCGTDIRPGRRFTDTNNVMILYFRTKSSNYRGWSARLTFKKVC